jgi:hypothetical protein
MAAFAIPAQPVEKRTIMHIHSDKITRMNVLDAARLARVDMETFRQHNSRTKDHAFEVALEGESRRRPNNRGRSNGYAATWDQWGVFLGALYQIDPNMLCGSGIKYAVYKNVDDFNIQTDCRFEDGTWPADAHGDHSWIVGTPWYQQCSKCSAVKRWGI